MGGGANLLGHELVLSTSVVEEHGRRESHGPRRPCGHGGAPRSLFGPVLRSRPSAAVEAKSGVASLHLQVAPGGCACCTCACCTCA